MMILVSGATRTVNRFPQLGRLVSPSVGNSLARVADSGRPWAADNEAFTAWDPERYWRMLRRIWRVDRTRLLWIVCPDVVGNAQETINRWIEWYPQIESLGLPVAFVGQNGLGKCWDQIPWHQMTAAFLGGDDEWKLGVEAEQFADEARARGLWLHMGRCNTRRRIVHAVRIGCDSIDGRTWSAWPDRWIPKGLRWIREATDKPLFAHR
jgi:hypothetical protein